MELTEIIELLQSDKSLDRALNESEALYIYRLYHLIGVHPRLQNSKDLAEILNDRLGTNYDESAFRKPIQAVDKWLPDLIPFIKDGAYEQIIRKKQELLYKQQVKTQDRLRELRGLLRVEARIENLKSYIIEAANSVKPLILPVQRPLHLGGNVIAANLLISDWHIGSQTTIGMGNFNLEEANRRVDNLYYQVVEYIEKFSITKLNVINLGDMIEGIINASVRVQNELDVIDSTIQAAELIATLLTRLSKHLIHISYYDTSDNHGRVFPDYKQNIEKENFGRLITWWLRPALARNEVSNVQIHTETIEPGNTLGAFEVSADPGVIGTSFAFAHGHLDKVTNVVEHFLNITHRLYDFIYLAHFHIEQIKKTTGNTTVIVNGSLKGVDDYSTVKRFGNSSATQTLHIVTENASIPIILDVL